MSLVRVPEGLKSIAASYRIAKELANPLLMERSALSHSFWLIETGDLRTAGKRLQRLKRFGSTFNQLELANALGCYYWNSNDEEAAVGAFKDGMNLIEGSDRLNQAHFWSNFSFFAAERGNPGAFNEAFGAAEASMCGLASGRIELTMNTAKAIQRGKRGDQASALTELDALGQSEYALCQPDMTLYLKEAAALIESDMGHYRSAKARWLEAERLRQSRGARLTPRLLAHRDLIFIG